MSWTNCGSKEVRYMFNRDRKELEKERFLQEEQQAFPNCKKCGAVLGWGDHPICPNCKNDEMVNE